MVTAAFCPSAIHAQTATTDGAEAGGTDIIVTAQRRSSTLTETPVSIQAFSAERLSEAGVSHLYDIARVTPGLRMDLVGTNLQPTIRGITTAVSGTGNAMNTAIYVDGFYQPSNLSNGLDLADTKQIEVVKGPQGTLFGRNATAGAILITTADPSYQFGGKAEVSYGSYDDKRANVFLTSGLTDNLAASGSIVYRNYEGFTHNILTGHKDGFYRTFVARGKIMYEPTDKLKFVLGGRYSHTNDPEGRIYRVVGTASTGFSIPGTVVATQPYTNSQGLEPMSRTNVKAVTLTSSYDLGWADLTSYTGYINERTRQQTDLDGTSAQITDIRTNTLTNTFSQEFIMSSKKHGPLDWTAGLNYFNQNDSAPYYSIATETVPNPPNQRSAKVNTNAYAAFVDATWEAVDNLFLTGGMRYSIERKDFLYGLTDPRQVDVNHTWKSFTPRAVIRYEVTKNSNVYASYSKGFKSGTYNASSASTTPVNPEKIEAWEVGVKMGGPLITWNSAAYYYKYRNLQVSAYNFLANPPSTMLQNVGRAEIYGADSDLTIHVDPNFRINISGAYTHARYKSFPGAISYQPNATKTAYSTVIVDASGNQMIRAPEWTGNLGLYYQIPTVYGTFAAAPSLYITSSFYSETANQYRINPYALFDMTISWTSSNDRWKVAVEGKNITNKYYVSYWDPTGSALMVADGAPRTVRVSLSTKF